MTDYRDYYSSNLEGYLLDQVRSNFLRLGFLSAQEFFCIVIWKANRMKSKIAKRLLKEAECTSLDEAVRMLTDEVAHAGTAEAKMRIVLQEWRFPLPTASAILTILYPEEFTVYDTRVANLLDAENGTTFGRLANRTAFKNQWAGYTEYIDSVSRSAPANLSLRDKDRYLWGKSFSQQLERDVQQSFSKRTS